MLTPEREKEIRSFIKCVSLGHSLHWSEELLAEIERLRSSLKPWNDFSDCQVTLDLPLKNFNKGFARGIISLPDGTLVNIGIKINAE